MKNIVNLMYRVYRTIHTKDFRLRFYYLEFYDRRLVLSLSQISMLQLLIYLIYPIVYPTT